MTDFNLLLLNTSLEYQVDQRHDSVGHTNLQSNNLGVYRSQRQQVHNRELELSHATLNPQRTVFVRFWVLSKCQVFFSIVMTSKCQVYFIEHYEAISKLESQC